MKTTFLYLFSILSIAMYSQDTEKPDQQENKVSIETQFKLFDNSGATNTNLKVRYHFNESHVLRTNWSFMHSSVTNEILEADGDGVGSIQSVASGHEISLGYERHFYLDKMSPYLGAAAGYGFGADSEYASRTDGTTFVNDFNYSQEQKFSAVSVDIFSGFDFNLYKGLYIGSEIGFRFTNTKLQRGELRTEDASSTTDATTTTPIPEQKSSSFSLVNMGVVRVGWKF